MRTLEMNEDTYEALLLLMGYAAGSAMREGNEKLYYIFLRTANEVNKDNPHWTPYEIPDLL